MTDHVRQISREMKVLEMMTLSWTSQTRFDAQERYFIDDEFVGSKRFDIESRSLRGLLLTI